MGALLEDIGKHSKDVDPAFPDKHTNAIYDTLNKKETDTLSQLRTGMARANSHLYGIGTSRTDQCDCGAAKEAVNYFLFLCARWDHLRAYLLQQVGTKIGGRSKNVKMDPLPWKPNMNERRPSSYPLCNGH